MNKPGNIFLLISFCMALTFLSAPILSAVSAGMSPTCFHMMADDDIQPAGDQHENECEDGDDIVPVYFATVRTTFRYAQFHVPELLQPQLNMVHADVFTPPPEHG